VRMRATVHHGEYKAQREAKRAMELARTAKYKGGGGSGGVGSGGGGSLGVERLKERRVAAPGGTEAEAGEARVELSNDEDGGGGESDSEGGAAGGSRSLGPGDTVGAMHKEHSSDQKRMEKAKRPGFRGKNM
jgi:hypothetical protein